MRNFGRGLLLVGASLFVGAAYSVIQARHTLRHSGGHLDDFALPAKVVLLVLLAAAMCMVGGLKCTGGFRPIHVSEGKTP
ncbi:conserved hypothetical protein [Neospora caninum Liverpool]|nr:conserved hypothetical protein [Neospora caninum Liverpool]CBZ49517.1 conserved hypothetical protein [Neospora caninum Liverpool]|eukprot:XP_003879552.1 conserved hypothetical protein [Neospora caninum Liverpool]